MAEKYSKEWFCQRARSHMDAVDDGIEKKDSVAILARVFDLHELKNALPAGLYEQVEDKMQEGRDAVDEFRKEWLKEAES